MPCLRNRDKIIHNKHYRNTNDYHNYRACLPPIHRLHFVPVDPELFTLRQRVPYLARYLVAFINLLQESRDVVVRMQIIIDTASISDMYMTMIQYDHQINVTSFNSII